MSVGASKPRKRAGSQQSLCATLSSENRTTLRILETLQIDKLLGTVAESCQILTHFNLVSRCVTCILNSSRTRLLCRLEPYTEMPFDFRWFQILKCKRSKKRLKCYLHDPFRENFITCQFCKVFVRNSEWPHPEIGQSHCLILTTGWKCWLFQSRWRWMQLMVLHPDYKF